MAVGAGDWGDGGPASRSHSRVPGHTRDTKRRKDHRSLRWHRTTADDLSRDLILMSLGPPVGLWTPIDVLSSGGWRRARFDRMFDWRSCMKGIARVILVVTAISTSTLAQ